MRKIKALYSIVCVILCLGMCFSFSRTALSPTFTIPPAVFDDEMPDGTPPAVFDEEVLYALPPENLAAEDFVLLPTAEFRQLLPKGVKSIVFSDALPPKYAQLTDLSSTANEGVVGWQAGDAYIISTRVAGQKVVFNADSEALFSGLTSLESIELSAVDTSLVKDFMRFFYECTSLKTADISSFSLASAIRTRSMFMNCSSLTSVTLDGIDTSTIRDTGFMFSGTDSLESIDLRGCDLSAVICTTAMFQNSGARSILLPDSLSVLGSFFMNHIKRYEATSFTLPLAAKELANAHLFYDMGTDAFTSFIVPEGNTNFKTIDGILYSADGTRLLAVPKGKRFLNGVFESPEGVTFLGELSFSRNPYMHTVLLPNSYRVTLYTELNHKDFNDISGAGNKNVGNTLNIAAYTYAVVKAYAVKADNPVYTAVNGVLYEKDASGEARVLIAIPRCYEGELFIPEGVTRWQADALFELSSASFDALTAIHIPESLIEIAPSQIERINSLGKTITVAEGNAVYTVSSSGKLVLK